MIVFVIFLLVKETPIKKTTVMGPPFMGSDNMFLIKLIKRSKTSCTS